MGKKQRGESQSIKRTAAHTIYVADDLLALIGCRFLRGHSLPSWAPCTLVTFLFKAV